jgi:hypothetical protein
MVKKGKTKKVKPVPVKADYKQKLNYDVQKDIKPDKINPNEIFQGFKEVKSMDKKKQLKKKNPKM